VCKAVIRQCDRLLLGSVLSDVAVQNVRLFKGVARIIDALLS
jgi:hypothetical protein